jgi:23S rRNA (pseudouridine1915-N3)-methyltransferase
MRLWIAIVDRKNPTGPAAQLLEDFVARSARYIPCELQMAPTEQKLLEAVDRAAGRTKPVLILADSTGALLTSTEFANDLTKRIDSGAQLLVLAIGPADGWSAAARARADLLLSFGRITLPHELAAVVAAEQLYRALTIRAGHPYHCGH